MYCFLDKRGRNVCLIPEVTAIIQDLYKKQWSKQLKKPVKVFYVSRCYRYEKPQKGRYREFNQFGVEILGGDTKANRQIAINLLSDCLKQTGLDNFTLNESVKRGLNYYTEEGFEAECLSLETQKQVAGGGVYNEGVGWAIGIDRLLIALESVV